MNRKGQRLLIEAFRRIRIAAEEGEAMSRVLSVQDIGPTAADRRKAIEALVKQATGLASLTTLLLQSLNDHLASSAVLDAIKYPRAKPLSSSKK